MPVFVLEYLLGKYAASSDEMAIQLGLQVVNETLANNYIRPDESTKARVKVRDLGQYTFIDKVKVRLVESDLWAEAVASIERGADRAPTRRLHEADHHSPGGHAVRLLAHRGHP